MARAFVGAGIIVAIASVLTAISAGPGYDAGLWHYRTGFIILRWSVYTAVAATVVALIGSVLAVARRRYRIAFVGAGAIAMALTVIMPTWQLQRTASVVPRIHDITTDTDNPPQFVALLIARQRSPNGSEYAGEKIAREQKAAYPDIQPVILKEPPAAAFERALAAARAMGWEIVAAVPTDGRIEATATTRWFRFKDDVVIRVTPQPAGSRIDVRSTSRLGRSDLGTNAKRVRAYFAALGVSR
jgi:uncharacterized protein (DUF1499 family)